MKKNLLYLVVVILLVVAAYFLLRSGGFSTLKPELRDFALTDTGSITKLVLANRNGEKVVLERTSPNEWRVNGKYEVNQQKISGLLETMKNLEVKSPVPEKDRNSVIIDLSTRNTLVRAYVQDKLVKSYFVGVQTVDQLGTYMLIEDSKSPFIMQIAGFNGYLNSRYSTRELDWKTRKVFSTPASEIVSINVAYPGNPEQSFTIKQNNNQPIIEPGVYKNMLINPDTQMLKYYVASFSSVTYEGYDQAFDQHKADSIKAMNPFCIMEVTNKKGTKSTIRIYYKAVDQRTMQQYDEKTMKPLTVDPERYYALLNDEKNLVIIQQYVFGKLLRTYPDFFNAKAASVK